MTKLELQPDKCVRYYSKHATCESCATICPTNAIKVQESSVQISLESCVSCGACNAACPHEAFLLEEYAPTAHFFNFIKLEENILSCKRDIPCIAAVSVEHLVSFVTQKGDILADTGYCSECKIGTLHENIQSNIAQANLFLESIGIEHRVSAENIKVDEPTQEDEPQSDRREFFKRFGLKGALKTKAEFKEISENLESEYKSIELDNSKIAGIRKNSLSDRRKIFFTALKRVPKPLEFRYLKSEEISFFSNKYIDESCTNCSICYRLCPTGALFSDVNHTKIEFDMLSCVKCGLCHDVCEPNSIEPSSIFTKEVFEPVTKELITFDIRRCDECANLFTYKGGELMCDSCKEIESDAKSLWGIQ